MLPTELPGLGINVNHHTVDQGLIRFISSRIRQDILKYAPKGCVNYIVDQKYAKKKKGPIWEMGDH